MHRIDAPRRLGFSLGTTGILISLMTAIGAHHVAGGDWPSLSALAILTALNGLLLVFARHAPPRLSAFLVLMLGAQFLDHAIMSMSHTSSSMCGHEQTRCALPEPMAMNTHAMALAHITATALSAWMAYLVMRLVRQLGDFFARLLTRMSVKIPILLAPRAVIFTSQIVRGIHHLIRAPRRGPPTKFAVCV